MKRVQKISFFLLRILPLLIMGIFLLNNTLFTHTHVLPGGKIVVHAHPFNKSSDDSSNGMHKHTKVEYTFLDHLSQDFQLFPVAMGMVLPFMMLGTHRGPLQAMHSRFRMSSPGRAPPHTSLSPAPQA